MKANVGTVDKTIRVIIGMVIIAIGAVAGSWWGLVGILPILTAFTGFCGLYALLGISTCKIRSVSPK
jgi:uncharacterized membrane protein